MKTSLKTILLAGVAAVGLLSSPAFAVNGLTTQWNQQNSFIGLGFVAAFDMGLFNNHAKQDTADENALAGIYNQSLADEKSNGGNLTQAEYNQLTAEDDKVEVSEMEQIEGVAAPNSNIASFNDQAGFVEQSLGNLIDLGTYSNKAELTQDIDQVSTLEGQAITIAADNAGGDLTAAEYKTFDGDLNTDEAIFFNTLN